MNLIDTHSHFDDPRLDAERDRIYADAQAAGVVMQVVPAISAATWPRTRAICTRYPGLYPCYGLHPWFLDEHTLTDLDGLAAWLNSNPAVAIGECGLDYFKPDLDKALQTTLLRGQLSLAADLDLPVVLHGNKAIEALILELRRSNVRKGVVHSYNGSLQQAHRLIELGFYVGLGGAMTYPRAKQLRRLAQQLPIERVLIETDAPDQPPQSRHGMLNSPVTLVEILRCLQTLRDDDSIALINRLNRNAAELFGIPMPESISHRSD